MSKCPACNENKSVYKTKVGESSLLCKRHLNELNTKLMKFIKHDKKWLTTDHDSYVEVKPLNDTKEHYAGDECWSHPRVERQQGSRPLISHNSMRSTNDPI